MAVIWFFSGGNSMKMNKHFTKKLLSIVLCLALVLSYLPVNIFAVESETIDVSTLTTDLVISPRVIP